MTRLRAWWWTATNPEAAAHLRHLEDRIDGMERSLRRIRADIDALLEQVADQ